MKVVVFAAFALLGGACHGSQNPGAGADAGSGPGPDGGSTGSDGGSTGSDGGSTGSDGGDGPMAPPVTVRTGEPPALIAFRDETSTVWTIPAAIERGVYGVDATGPYRVA